MTSLFTNIPLSETIKLTVDIIKTSQLDLNISAKDLTSLFNFATCETHFVKGKFYDQIHGAAMGSPLASVLANLFMGHCEKEWLSTYDGVSPSCYTQYADDVCLVFSWHDEAKRVSFIVIQRP